MIRITERQVIIVITDTFFDISNDFNPKPSSMEKIKINKIILAGKIKLKTSINITFLKYLKNSLKFFNTAFIKKSFFHELFLRDNRKKRALI